MRFPLIDILNLPCAFERLIPGQLHPDGRRYLPLIVLRPTDPTAGTITPDGLRLGVVDRHHRVDPASAGRSGLARLVFALSAICLQQAPYRLGLLPEEAREAGAAALAPTLFGRVVALGAWERGDAHLPYQTLYAELVIDTGMGIVGMRTSLTAEDLTAAIGAEQLAPGDWVELRRSRIDILSFEPSA
ncbi:MAG: hypothetical protein HGA65_17675 [Oscillochloris sp.]|nr:hypothetical protein [Oscillochloris sp.]